MPRETIGSIDLLTGLPNQEGLAAQVAAELRLRCGVARAILLVIEPRIGGRPARSAKSQSEVARKLSTAFRSNDILASLPGGRFAVLVFAGPDLSAPSLAARIEQLPGSPSKVKRQLQMVSAGVCAVFASAEDLDDCLQKGNRKLDEKIRESVQAE